MVVKEEEEKKEEVEEEKRGRKGQTSIINQRRVFMKKGKNRASVTFTLSRYPSPEEANR